MVALKLQALISAVIQHSLLTWWWRRGVLSKMLVGWWWFGNWVLVSTDTVQESKPHLSAIASLKGVSLCLWDTHTFRRTCIWERAIVNVETMCLVSTYLFHSSSVSLGGHISRACIKAPFQLTALKGGKS